MKVKALYFWKVSVVFPGEHLLNGSILNDVIVKTAYFKSEKLAKAQFKNWEIKFKSNGAVIKERVALLLGSDGVYYCACIPDIREKVIVNESVNNEN